MDYNVAIYQAVCCVTSQNYQGTEAPFICLCFMLLLVLDTSPPTRNDEQTPEQSTNYISQTVMSQHTVNSKLDSPAFL